MTCTDSVMLSSVIKDAGAHYIAEVMFAITAVVVGVLRSLWRRRSRMVRDAGGPASEGPVEGPSDTSRLCATEHDSLPNVSSKGRRGESS